MAYAIRRFQESDAQAVADLTLLAIRDVGSHAYDLGQVEARASRHPGPERFLTRHAAGSDIFVAADANDEVVAYALLDNAGEDSGHLDMLYCHPEHTRRGLATELLIAAEQHAVNEGHSRLFTEASELARPAFERAGYSVLHRRDFTIEHANKDVPIHNYAMEKRLD